MTRRSVRAGFIGGGLVACALLPAACSSATGGSTITNSNPNLILREQILAMPEGSALEVVQRYRSGWLRPRSQGTVAGAFRDPSSGTVQGDPDMPIVFIDDVRYGDVQSLARIPSTGIESMVFISATDATTLYGTGYTGGIIRINTIDAN
jgi:hypothetical protein